MIGKSGLLVLFVVAFAYSQIDSTTPATATPLSGGQGWGLVWSDEFEGSEIDSTKWTKQVSAKTRSPRTDKCISD